LQVAPAHSSTCRGKPCRRSIWRGTGPASPGRTCLPCPCRAWRDHPQTCPSRPTWPQAPDLPQPPRRPQSCPGSSTTTQAGDW